MLCDGDGPIRALRAELREGSRLVEVEAGGAQPRFGVGARQSDARFGRTRFVVAVGDRDVVYHFPGGGPQMVDNLKRWVPNLKQGIVLEGCGHWTQQERPSAVNRLLLEFLASL